MIRVLPLPRRLRAVALLGALCAAAPAAVVEAQDGYLFRPPVGALTLRLGGQAPLARSDVFDFTSEQLTLDRARLAGFSWGLDADGRLSDRFSWVVSGDVHRRRAPSEYRAWQDADGTPIAQTTEFFRVPLTAGLRYALRAPGERIGQFAFVPARAVPWVSAGAGMTWYRFRQRGDFVDFTDGNAIFFDEFSSDGWAPTVAAAAGVDVPMGTTVALTSQVRGTWGRARLGPDFRGFAPIDLSGVTFTVGVRLVAP